VSDFSKFFKGAADPSLASKAPPVRIETPRLVIREIRPDDADRFFEISTTPGFYYYCFDGTRESAEAFVSNAIANQVIDAKTGRRESYVMAVELKSTGECIGHVAIEPVDFWKPEVQANVNFYDGVTEEQKKTLGEARYEVNYFIDPKHQSGGLGSEAAVNMTHYAFSTLGLLALSVTQHPVNTASINVSRAKLGYVPIGETQIDTTNGPEPRILSICTGKEFYERRKQDRFQYILGYNEGAAAKPNDFKPS